jgi:hypothetical protein
MCSLSPLPVVPIKCTHTVLMVDCKTILICVSNCIECTGLLLLCLVTPSCVLFTIIHAREQARVCRLSVVQLFVTQINKHTSTSYFRGTHVGKLTLCVIANVFDVWLSFCCGCNLKETHISTSTCHSKLVSYTKAHHLSLPSHHLHLLLIVIPPFLPSIF